uniref:Uncharacterized protein n=1 Tax=Glossina brevipalpis TaxID=37001 RepID=A0A1A9WI02_9MUSC
MAASPEGLSPPYVDNQKSYNRIHFCTGCTLRESVVTSSNQYDLIFFGGTSVSTSGSCVRPAQPISTRTSPSDPIAGKYTGRHVIVRPGRTVLKPPPFMMMAVRPLMRPPSSAPLCTSAGAAGCSADGAGDSADIGGATTSAVSVLIYVKY